MVLLGQTGHGPSALVRHRGPSRRAFAAFGTAATATPIAVAGCVIATYDEHPPWGPQIAYEAGYVQGTRIRHRDVRGELGPELLDGGCARLEQEGLGGTRATHDPARWVEGCLDGAAGRPSKHQGLLEY